MDAFSYAHGASTTPLLGETIGENLRKTTERFPDREALVVRSQGYRATYRGLWDATTRVARALIARGIARGDRVAIWSPNRFECRAGWMHTGDLATMDDEGYVNIVGRIKDMIICGGENVYPREVVTEFPMTVTGKVQKFRMRDTSIAELGLTAVAGAPTA